MREDGVFRGKSRGLFSACACHFGSAAAAGISRRDFLAGGAAAGFLATGFAAPLAAEDKPHRIDVHCHIAPPAWLEAMEIIGRKDPVLAGWSVQKLLDDMDQGGVATAVVSVTTPQLTPLGKDAAVRIARESNDYAKKLHADHPGRFGIFAMLPLPHIDESLAEIAYAFDTLHVDGVGIMTSYRDKWLGDPSFAPVFAELNRRKAVVYTHPTAANCCVNLLPGVNDSMIEFATDTARSIGSVIFTGTSQKYHDISWIWSHGGGSLTAIAERFELQMVKAPEYRDKFNRAIVDGEIDRFFYDTAQISNAITLDALARLVPVSQIVYGTDFPYRTSVDHSRGVASHFKGDDLIKVERDNALRLIPRLRSA